MRRTLALACLLVLVLGACAETKDTGFPPPAEPSPTATEDHGDNGNGAAVVQITGPIDMGDSYYTPKRGKVAAGTTVVWEQSGTEPHSVTFDDGSFDSSPDCPPLPKCTQLGDEVTYTFSAAGEFPYYCKIHGAAGGIGMAGVVIVE